MYPDDKKVITCYSNIVVHTDSIALLMCVMKEGIKLAGMLKCNERS